MKPHLFGSVHLLIESDDQLLMLQRQNTGFEDGNWSVVAGKIDAEEDMLSTVQREAKEEVGITIKRDQIEVVGVLHRYSETLNWVDFFVRISEWEGSIYNAEPDKCSALEWYAKDQLPINTIDYVQKVIAKNEPTMWYDSFGWKS